MIEFFAESVTPAVRAESPREPAGLRPRAGRSRAGGLAAAAAVISLLAAGAAGCSSSSSGNGKPGGTAAAGTAPTGIQVPAKIGSLAKGAEDPNGFKDSGLPKSVTKNLHTVSYAVGGDSLRSVLITGGLGLPVPTDGPSDKIKRLFSEWDVGSAGAKLTSVPAGPVGGLAECAPYDTAYKEIDCGWVGGKVALTLGFTGIAKDKARALVPQILSAMVTR